MQPRSRSLRPGPCHHAESKRDVPEAEHTPAVFGKRVDQNGSGIGGRHRGADSLEALAPTSQRAKAKGAEHRGHHEDQNARSVHALSSREHHPHVRKARASKSRARGRPPWPTRLLGSCRRAAAARPAASSGPPAPSKMTMKDPVATATSTVAPRRLGCPVPRSDEWEPRRLRKADPSTNRRLDRHAEVGRGSRSLGLPTQGSRGPTISAKDSCASRSRGRPS